MTSEQKPVPAVLDLNALESAARAASPGAWSSVEDHDGFTFVMVDNVAKAEILPSNRKRGEDSSYIAAARPEVVLALIERLRAAEAGITVDQRDAVADHVWNQMVGVAKSSVREVLADAFGEAGIIVKESA